MIPVGTSVNPGELRSGPKWEKMFISYPQPPTLSLESTFYHITITLLNSSYCKETNSSTASEESFSSRSPKKEAHEATEQTSNYCT